jgi:chromosome segregation ATPase
MDYIPIRDFAVEAGVSRQAVYSRLDSPSIATYVKIDSEGHKVIHRNALALFKSTPENIEQVSQDNESRLIDTLKRENALLRKNNDEISSILDENRILIDKLTGQLNIANEQIKALTLQLDARAGEIATLHRLIDQQQQLSLAQLKVLPAAESVHTAHIKEQPERPAEPVKARSKSRLEHLRSIFRR